MKKYQKQFILTTEKLQKNLGIFKGINNKYSIFTDELLEYLAKEGMFDCPASTALSMHNCFKGGLLDHIIRVGKYAVEINKLLPEKLQQEKESIIKVVFLHSIGKVGLYEENDSKWHKDNLGQYWKYKEDQDVAMRIGERSIFSCLKFGVQLEPYEYQSILNVYKDLSEDKQAKYFSDPLTIILRQSIDLAMMEEQKRFEEFNN